MAQFTFQQVDVFAAQPLRGNPLAVVATTMYHEMGMTYWLEKAEAEMTEGK